MSNVHIDRQRIICLNRGKTLSVSSHPLVNQSPHGKTFPKTHVFPLLLPDRCMPRSIPRVRANPRQPHIAESCPPPPLSKTLLYHQKQRAHRRCFQGHARARQKRTRIYLLLYGIVLWYAIYACREVGRVYRALAGLRITPNATPREIDGDIARVKFEGLEVHMGVTDRVP